MTTPLSNEHFDDIDRDALNEAAWELTDTVHDIDFHELCDGVWFRLDDLPTDAAGVARDLRDLIDRVQLATAKALVQLDEVERTVRERAQSGGNGGESHG